MPIITKDRFFGEGISGYGEEAAETAFSAQKEHIREKRLNDSLGADSKLNNSQLSHNFEKVKAAIEAADDQVYADNADFVKKHGIKR